MSNELVPSNKEIAIAKEDSIAKRALAYVGLGRTEVVPTAPKRTDLNEVHSTPQGLQIQAPKAVISINGSKFRVDPRELMRIVKNITQSIGENKSQDNVHAEYVLPALRKARSQVVADLEKHFRISWKIDPTTGESIFYTL